MNQLADLTHFFIFANPRSGSTLLRLMLNSHENLCVPPECGFLDWLFDDFNNRDEFESDYTRFAAAVAGCKKFETWQLDSASIQAALKTLQPTSYLEMCLCVYLAYANKVRKNPRALGDKNNYYIKRVDRLTTAFPCSKKIFLIRDGRDVTCSYLDLASRNSTSQYFPKLSTSINAIAKEWRKNVEAALRYQSKGALVILYEGLLQQPEKSLKQVCAYLNVKYSATMLKYDDFVDEPPEFLEWKNAVTGPLKSSNYGKYKTCLTSRQISEFETIAGDALFQLGYL